MNIRGEIVRGVIRSTDASSTPATTTLYEPGSTTSRTLQSNEYLEIYHLNAVAAATGDLRVFFDADDGDDLDAGEDIFRGDVGANGGIERNFPIPVRLPAGKLPKVLAAAGNVDVQFEAGIRREGTTGRPSWKEADFGQ